MKNLFILALIFILQNSQAQTQQVKFNLITGAYGISLGKINTIIQDHHGFIWLSDQSNRCIIRYDGTHMIRYQNDPKVPNSLGGYYPECLHEDSVGNIWIGFYGQGLDRFDPLTNKFVHYKHDARDPNSLSDDFVSAILVDHLGLIWIATYGGLDLLDAKTGTFKHFSHKENDSTSLSNNKLRALYEDKAGTLWVGAGFPFDNNTEGGLNRFHRETGTFTRYMHDENNPHSLADNKVRAIYEDSKGNFWIGTRGDGLHTMDRKTGMITRFSYDPKHPDALSRPSIKHSTDHITFITEDADQNLWIGTLANGIIQYNPDTKQIKHYGDQADDSGPYRENSSWAMYATKDGMIFLATQAAKLYMIDLYNNFIPHYGNDHQNNVEGTQAFYEASPNMIWYGTNNGLVYKDFTKSKRNDRIKVPEIKIYQNNPLDAGTISDNEVY